MSAFSDVLKKRIEYSNIPIKTLASLSGVNRTHIQKMIKGDRTPSDMEVLSKLINLLMLTPEESLELKKLYRIARMGEGIYERHLLVKELIEGIESISSNNNYSIKIDFQHDLSNMPSINTVYGSNNINNLLKVIFEAEASRPSGNIKMIVQPEYSFLMKLLTSIGIEKKELTITHIMCLKRCTDRKEINEYNIKCVKNILPILVSVSNYNPMYYYDDIGGSINSASILPYIILTDACVINISSDLSCATIFRESRLIDFYSKAYTKVYDQSKTMITKLNTPSDLLKHYMDIENFSKVSNLSFFDGPCLALFFTEEMIKNYMSDDLPDKEGILNSYIARIENYHNLLRSNYCIISIFSEEGIDKFIETGRIAEVPSEYYTPIDKSDCLHLLERMQELSKQGLYSPIIVDSKKFKIPNNFIISAPSENCISMIYAHPTYGSISFALKESSISHAIYSFLTYLKSSDLILPSKDIEIIIQNKIDKMKAVFSIQ